jgi:hypothetical protein
VYVDYDVEVIFVAKITGFVKQGISFLGGNHHQQEIYAPRRIYDAQQLGWKYTSPTIPSFSRQPKQCSASFADIVAEEGAGTSKASSILTTTLYVKQEK